MKSNFCLLKDCLILDNSLILHKHLYMLANKNGAQWHHCIYFGLIFQNSIFILTSGVLPMIVVEEVVLNCTVSIKHSNYWK